MPGSMRVTVGDRYEQWAVGRARQHIISHGELILSHQSQGCLDLPRRCVAFLLSCLDHTVSKAWHWDSPVFSPFFSFLRKQITIPGGNGSKTCKRACFVFYTLIRIAIYSTALDERMSSHNCVCERIKVTALGSHIFLLFFFFFFWLIGCGSPVERAKW